jgi:hypothetical protein
MKTLGSTDINRDRRILATKKIMLQLKLEHKPISRNTVFSLIRAQGFDVEEGTVYRDIVLINRENSWVRDLVESNYSAMQEHISEMLDFIEKEALENYSKTWTMNRTVKKIGTTSKGEFESEEETTTQEMAAPKAQFLMLIGKVQELRMKHTHGDNINISAALLSRELQEAKESLKKDTEKANSVVIVPVTWSKKLTLDEP